MLKRISEYLEQLDYKHHFDEEKEMIVFGARGDNELWFLIKASDNEFRMALRPFEEDNNKIDIPNSTHKMEILEYLLYKNYQIKFLKWQYDPSDGHLIGDIHIPLDGNFSLKQLERSLKLLQSEGDEVITDLKSLDEHGKTKDQLAEEASDLDLEKLKKLQALMETHPELKALLDSDSI